MPSPERAGHETQQIQTADRTTYTCSIHKYSLLYGMSTRCCSPNVEVSCFDPHSKHHFPSFPSHYLCNYQQMSTTQCDEEKPAQLLYIFAYRLRWCSAIFPKPVLCENHTATHRNLQKIILFNKFKGKQRFGKKKIFFFSKARKYGEEIKIKKKNVFL